MIDIPSYYVVCYLFSNCSAEISLFPEMTTPKLFLNLWKLFEYLTARYTFQNPYYFGYRISGRERQQYMNMIFRNFTSVYLKIKMVCYLNKKFSNSILNATSEDLFPVFRTPDQMIFRFINRMTCSFDIHAGHFIWKAVFPQALKKSPIRLEKSHLSRFSSPTKGRSIQAHFS